MLRKIKCWFVGHQWRYIKVNLQVVFADMKICKVCNKKLGTIVFYDPHDLVISDEHKDMHNYY